MARASSGRNGRAKILRPAAVDLLQNGYTTQEIATQLDVSESWVLKVAYENDISPMTEVKRERELLIKFVQQYKARGMSAPEISEKFGINVHFIRKYCVGICPQDHVPVSERVKKPIQQIEELGFEYVGGFVDTDSYVTIRCPKCGEVFERSMISIRKKDATRCPKCYERERAEEKERQQREKAEARQKAEAERLRLKEERERKAEEKRLARLHPCSVCGELTTRKTYCSQECAKKAANAQQEVRRRTKVKDALVDKGITLKRLYERDHGICYLCGEKCDWNDKEERDGTIICGNRYPSVEHVIPLSKGGEHSWENVRLAHRICNTRKRDRILSTTSSPTISK